MVADLLKVADCARTIEEAVTKMGGLDILVNSGGVWTDAMLSEPLGEKAFLDGLTMHVITVAQLIEEAIPHLSKNKVRTGHSCTSDHIHVKYRKLSAPQSEPGPFSHPCSACHSKDVRRLEVVWSLRVQRIA